MTYSQKHFELCLCKIVILDDNGNEETKFTTDYLQGDSQILGTEDHLDKIDILNYYFNVVCPHCTDDFKMAILIFIDTQNLRIVEIQSSFYDLPN